MRTTQRQRFKVIDVWQGLTWASPVGEVTFTEHEELRGYFWVTVDDLYNDKIEWLATSDTMAVRFINMLIKVGYDWYDSNYEEFQNKVGDKGEAFK